MLRGRAAEVAFFRDNVLVHDDLDAAVSLKKRKLSTGIGESHTDFNFHAGGNRFNTDYSAEIAAGDFDGDGRTDVFVANGTA
jgi:FG-GAP repeat